MHSYHSDLALKPKVIVYAQEVTETEQWDINLIILKQTLDIRRMTKVLYLLAKQHQVLYKTLEGSCLTVDELLCQFIDVSLQINRHQAGKPFAKFAEGFQQLRREFQKKIFKEILHPNGPDSTKADIVWKNTAVDNSVKNNIKK